VVSAGVDDEYIPAFMDRSGDAQDAVSINTIAGFQGCGNHS